MVYYNALGRALPLSGAPTQIFSGTAGDDELTGTSGNDYFYDGGGNDSFTGGKGDDIYAVGPDDKIVELAGEGIDTISSWASFALPANVENLKLTSNNAWYGIGNGRDNLILGTDGDQQLDGGGGNDVLVGGGGSDLFVISRGKGSDAIEDFSPGTDKIRISGHGLTDFSQVSAIMTQTGADTHLNFANGEKLVLRGVTASSLTAEDFRLGIDTSNMELTFRDEFYSLSLADEGGRWRTVLSGGASSTNPLAGRFLHNEEQVYMDPAFAGTGTDPLGVNPFSLSNGVLTITAAPASDSVAPYLDGHSYTSGVLSSKFSFAQQYGYFEIRAAMPEGQGFWPAFWMMPADGSWPPELDVFEALGRDPDTIYMTSHAINDGEHVTEQDRAYVDTTQFHRYGVNWTKEKLTFYIDGVAVAEQATPESMHKEMYLIANLAVGGPWAGAPDGSTGTGQMKIDYIRAYANEDTARATTSTSNATEQASADTPSTSERLGTAGNDTLKGGTGDDHLIGLAGNDILSGGAGKDLLEGGTGDDRMRGGSGEDRFLLEPGFGHDVIVDYASGIDTLLLKGFDESDLRLEQSADGVLLHLGDDTLELVGASLADPHLQDRFIF